MTNLTRNEPRLAAILLCLLLVAPVLHAAPQISVLGLFPGQAILRIDGQQRILKPGQSSPEGVRLISANADSALVEVDGQQRTLRLSHHIGSRFTPSVNDEQVTLIRSPQGMYIAPGTINGLGFDMIVDTGATYVAMNSQHAKRIGLAYRTRGRVVRMSTAGGYTDAYKLSLRSVRLGGIEVKDVDVVVQEGRFPDQVLLGMSFLGKLDMEHRPAGVLVLRQKP